MGAIEYSLTVVRSYEHANRTFTFDPAIATGTPHGGASSTSATAATLARLEASFEAIRDDEVPVADGREAVDDALESDAVETVLLSTASGSPRRSMARCIALCSDRQRDVSPAVAGTTCLSQVAVPMDMCATFSDDDVGKAVENGNGEAVGVITAVEGDIAHVRPDLSAVESITSSLGWEGAVEMTVTLERTSVRERTADAVQLEGSLPLSNAADDGSKTERDAVND